MTDDAIREGFANLRDEAQYQPLYLAGLSRAIGDWLLGMNATRLYTLKYGNNSYGRGQVLSIGRVQTPTLALIVERQKEIDNFKPEPYWVLATVYRDTQFTATRVNSPLRKRAKKLSLRLRESLLRLQVSLRRKVLNCPNSFMTSLLYRLIVTVSLVSLLR